MRRSSLFMALALLMTVSCKKPEPPPPPPPPPPPTVRVQVISVDPSRVDVGAPFSAQVFGSGFQPGIEVYIGTTRIAAAERFDSNTIEISSPPLLRGTHDLMVKNADGTSHTLRNAITSRNAAPPTVDPTAGLNCTAITINFGFDASSLDDSARSALTKHLLCFTTGTGTVRVEGHADERGTTTYNLALGQRRADTIRRWMSAQGVPPARIRTVSFGEERPVDSAHNEAAWARNRRSEISAPR
jgi:outer membrane protein OmpA-like peptidoglycan-associated protein